jgi:integrase/recombinase XerD
MARKGQGKRPPIVGDPTDPRGMAVLRDKYLEHLAVTNFSPRTIDVRTFYLNHFIKWCEERALVRPSDVTKPVIDRYQRGLFLYRNADNKPLSFHSQRGHLTPLKGWFRWLTRENHILYNPASELDLPRVNKSLPRHILSAAEAEQIINQTNINDPLGVRDRAILETLYSTGLRRLEMVRLKLYDLDVERATVMVRDGKWHKDRLVPVGERALLWLDKYLADVRPLLAGGVREEALFLTNIGEAFSADRMSGLARHYLEKAQLPGGKHGACHIFRHTMATLMLEGGADIRYIQAMLGHADLNTTQIYTQVGIRHLKQVHAATHPTGMLKRPGSLSMEQPASASDAPSPSSPAGADSSADVRAVDDDVCALDSILGDDDDADDG